MRFENWMKNLFGNLWSPDFHKAERKDRRARLHIDILEERTVPTASLRLAAMGDSLTASYAGFPGRSSDLSWTQQIDQKHPEKTDVFNEAVAGATSSDVLNGGQAEAVHNLVAAGDVDYVTLIVGANDLEAELYADLPILLGGNPALFYQTFVQNFTMTVAGNVQNTLDYVSTAGDVGWVVSNIPDVTITPAYAGTDSFILFTLHDAVVSANVQIEALAAARQIPMIDLYELSHLTETPFTIGRVTVTNLYAADGFHPNTVAQGVLADTILEALHSAYDAPVKHFVLSDQQILANAGIAHRHGRPTYFDVSAFVIFHGSSEPHHWCPSGGRTTHPHFTAGRTPGRAFTFESHDEDGRNHDLADARTSKIGGNRAPAGKQ